jgi:hypothetical protein
MVGKQKEWTPNTERLVRSAIKDERYCSYILDHLERPATSEGIESVKRLERLWLRASQSDYTVAQFIHYQTTGETP